MINGTLSAIQCWRKVNYLCNICHNMEMMYDREICVINKSIYITMEKGFHRSIQNDSLRWINLKQNMIPFILRQCNKWKFYIIYFSRNDGRKGKRFSHFELSISAIACEQRQQIIKNENDQNRGRDGTLKKETKKVKGWIKE